jgi:hypothetical protein
MTTLERDTVTTIKALVFIPGESVGVHDIEPTLANMQRLVGGYLEEIYLSSNARMYVDEEGMVKVGQPLNTGAALFLGRYGGGMRMIVGKAVVLGRTRNGVWTDCPDDLIGLYPRA